MVTKVSLQSVTCQLEVHLLLLTTFRVQHSLPQSREVKAPGLLLTGTTREARTKRHRRTRNKKTCAIIGKQNVKIKTIPNESSIVNIVLYFEKEYKSKESPPRYLWRDAFKVYLNVQHLSPNTTEKQKQGH